jgi:hypothetical protein
MLYPINPYNDYYSSVTAASLFDPYQMMMQNAYPLAPIQPQSYGYLPPAKKELSAPFSFIKEVFINGLTIAASMAGGKLGGTRGAILSGAIASAALGIVDQKLILNQKLDWISVLLDGMLGLIPGRVPESIAIGGRNVLKRSTGMKLDIGTDGSTRRAIAVGITDGLVMGSVGGFAHSLYDNFKETGEINLENVVESTVTATLPAVVGGGIGAGLFMRYWKSHWHVNRRL